MLKFIPLFWEFIKRLFGFKGIDDFVSVEFLLYIAHNGTMYLAKNYDNFGTFKRLLLGEREVEFTRTGNIAIASIQLEDEDELNRIISLLNAYGFVVEELDYEFR